GNEIFQLAFVLNGATSDDIQWYIDNISIYEPFAIPFTEDFTGVTVGNLPDCWSFFNTDSYVTPYSLAGGTSPELQFFCEPGVPGENITYLPTIDATTNSNLTLNFKHLATFNTNPFDLRLDYTIDNGVTWNTVWEKANITAEIDPETVIVDLSAVDGEIFQLAFILQGDNDDISWNIDDISIYEEIICDPLSIPFTEDFTGVTAGNLPNCWNKSHINWSVSETSDAGGSSPELMLDWDPEVTDDIIVYLPTIDATSNSNLAMSFIHFVNYYDNLFDLRLDYTIDDGATWSTAWDIINVNSNITSEEVYIDLSSFVDGEVFKLAFVFSGYTRDIDYWYIDNISIYERNTINEIDVDSDVNDVYVCVGDNEATALAALAPQMKINDTNGVEYIVDLTWTIASYDANTSDAYNATGTFALPTGVEQTTIPTPLEVTAIVTVNDPLVIIFDFETEYCLGSTPGALPTTSVNNITGTWSPATITTTALGETDYTFTPDAGECTDLPYLIISVTVVDIPVVTCLSNFTITENSIVTLSGGLPAGGIYSGTGVTGNSFDPSSLVNGDYTITYTYPGTGCSNSCDFIITVNVANSISSNETAEISIYPNPNNGMFNISFGNVNGEVYYQIYDTQGSIIVNKNIHTNGDTIEEVSLNLTSGVYFVRIITETQTLIQKLVIE
ncbi:MAG: T9SS type A sorting domain-containing protein, partial [Bacteroidales bacterium]|nr:T9SS type A sorting domain-containing protein [Bacteroidales bacterium]